MAFNPMTGQFETNRNIATLDPAVYASIKDDNQAVVDEAQVLREHLFQSKQHLREIKARLRALEATPQSVVDLVPGIKIESLEAHTSDLQDFITALTTDLVALGAKVDKLTQDLEVVATKQPQRLVEVKMDQALASRLEKLETASPEDLLARDILLETTANLSGVAEEVKVLKKQMLISFSLTAAGCIYYFIVNVLLA